MDDLQSRAIKTYRDNLGYFAKEHPDLHKKLLLFEEAIQSGRYKEKFALEYRPEGFFDVLDTESGNWLYGTSSVEHAGKMAREINYRKDQGVIETFYNFSFDEKGVEVAKQADPSASRFVTTAPIIDYVAHSIDKHETTMKEIYKFIFLGVGLGLHIAEIHKKIGARVYFVTEENLEIFRLSLFVTEFSTIGRESKIYFSVMENDFSFKERFNAFFHDAFIRNNYIKYALFYGDYEKKIKQIQNFIVTQSHLTYPHDKLLRKNIRVLERIHEKRKFFDLSTCYSQSPLRQRPLILVAAGPSLNREIEWLKTNAPYATVVALFMTSAILEKEGIVPDIVVHVDEQSEPVAKTLKRMENPENFFRNSVFFLAPSVDMALFEPLIDGENVYFFEDRTRYRFELGHLEGFSVGEIAYALSLIWGADEIYLLGLDLALDAESGKTHAGGHISGEKSRTAEDSGDAVSLRGSTFEVRGNFLEKVMTTPLFDMSIHQVNRFTREIKNENQKVYNLGNGAFFERTVPMASEKVSFVSLAEKRPEERSALSEFFDENASSNMSEKEKSAFLERVKEANEKLRDVQEFGRCRYPRMSAFSEGFIELASEMIRSPHANANELSQILIIFLENVGGYIGDFFNTREIDNPKRHIKQLQKLVSAQFEKIIGAYLTALNDRFNESGDTKEKGMS